MAKPLLSGSKELSFSNLRRKSLKHNLFGGSVVALCIYPCRTGRLAASLG
jgi:hypothetical protein